MSKRDGCSLQLRCQPKCGTPLRECAATALRLVPAHGMRHHPPDPHVQQRARPSRPLRHELPPRQEVPRDQQRRGQRPRRRREEGVRVWAPRPGGLKDEVGGRGACGREQHHLPREGERRRSAQDGGVEARAAAKLGAGPGRVDDGQMVERRRPLLAGGQPGGHLGVAPSRCHPQSRPLVAHHRGGPRGAVRAEELDCGEVPVVDGEKEGGAADAIGLVHRCPSGAQHRNHVRVALFAGEEHRCVTIAVCQIDCRACGAQHRDGLCVAVLTREDERRRSAAVCSGLVDGVSRRQQRADLVGPAVASGVEQRRILAVFAFFAFFVVAQLDGIAATLPKQRVHERGERICLVVH
mmetsp:Transcript_32370/g.105917  ORF Transcript_32370/g.105917 Transcript_32370/m.105917 type:complete len:352 (+) Transcript_32370:256-1311(+)